MDPKNITALVVGSVVCVLIFSALLVPIISEATTTENTVVNTGAYRMTDDDSEYEIVYDPVALSLTVNGDEYAFSSIPADSYTIVSVPEFILRLQNWAAQSYNLWFINESGSAVVASNLSQTSITFTFENGTATSDVWDDPVTYTTGQFRGYDPANGNYVMTNGIDKPILDKDSSIIVGHGTTAVNAWNNIFYIEGTVEGVTVDTLDTITVSDITVNADPEPKYKNGYTLTSITFEATDGEHTADATYNRVIVPAEVTLEYAVHPDNATLSLLSVLPIIAMIGIILAVVGAFVVSRNDY